VSLGHVFHREQVEFEVHNRPTVIPGLPPTPTPNTEKEEQLLLQQIVLPSFSPRKERERELRDIFSEETQLNGCPTEFKITPISGLI
jgi:hypothetical protein